MASIAQLADGAAAPRRGRGAAAPPPDGRAYA